MLLAKSNLANNIHHIPPVRYDVLSST